MSQTFWGLYSDLDFELLQIKSLIKGARCIRENEAEENAEVDLFSLAEGKIEESRETLKELNREYRKLEEEGKNSDSPSREQRAKQQPTQKRPTKT